MSNTQDMSDSENILISFNKVSKFYNNKAVIDDISFSVTKGEICVLIGPSGSGKSTILRCINKLVIPDNGRIDVNLDSDDRIGMVFQHFNLFVNMTVMENVSYALNTVLKLNKDQVEERAAEALHSVGMYDFRNQRPSRLSGGQKQRVAIARALAMKPEVLLLDEPTSALDIENIKEVLDVIKKLADHQITMLIATHQMKFAHDVSDKIMFVENGKIVEYTDSKVFFNQPKTKRACKFLELVDI